jgi:hypothetical protein
VKFDPLRRTYFYSLCPKIVGPFLEGETVIPGISIKDPDKNRRYANPCAEQCFIAF